MAMEVDYISLSFWRFSYSVTTLFGQHVNNGILFTKPPFFCNSVYIHEFDQSIIYLWKRGKIFNDPILK